MDTYSSDKGTGAYTDAGTGTDHCACVHVRAAHACTGSLKPVLYSVFIFFVVTAMFGVIGRNTFYMQFPDEFYNFGFAMFTMYQVATGDR